MSYCAAFVPCPVSLIGDASWDWRRRRANGGFCPGGSFSKREEGERRGGEGEGVEGGRWHSHVKYLLVKLRKNEVSSRALCAAIVCFLTHVDRRQEGPAASHRTVKPDKWSGTRAVGASPTAVVLRSRREGEVQGRLGRALPRGALSCIRNLCASDAEGC